MLTYQVKTGILQANGAIIGKGYSGHGEGINNPDMEMDADIGPLPRGDWELKLIADDNGNPIDYKGKKAPVFHVIPCSGTETFGRSGFLMHGHMSGEIVGNPETEKSSLGCLVQEHATRVQVMISTDKRLRAI